MSTSSDDLTLLRRLRAGEEAAFVELVERHHESLVRFAMTFVRSEAAAEEVAQDTWMGMLSGLPGFEERSSVKTWLFRILANQAKTRGVRDARSTPFSALGELEDGGGPDVSPDRFDPAGMWAKPPSRWGDDTPERLALRGEAMALVERTIDALPPQQRAVMLLRDVEGESAEDVCNTLGISETNQRVLLHRARMRVRLVLEQYLTEEP
jgi:RNA polymerase sigma-70 factor (ECF subfamily)